MIALLSKGETASVNPLVLKGLTEKPVTSLNEVATVYGEILKRVEANWKEQLKQASEKNQPVPARLADDAEEELRRNFMRKALPPASHSSSAGAS